MKRDWPEIFNVNCDLYLFFYVKRDRGTSVKRDRSFIFNVIRD